MIPWMQSLFSTECRSCGARVSLFSRACPNCDAHNQWRTVAIAAGACAILLVAGLLALALHAFRKAEAPQVASQTVPGGGAPAAPAEGASDYGWLVPALADCGEEAKRLADTLTFLIVPVRKTGSSLTRWATI